MSGEKYRFDLLAKEMVVARLKGDPDAPAKAADLARQTIVAGIKGTKAAGSTQPPSESVRLITKGIIAGLLLLEADLAEGSVEILKQLADAGQQVGLESTEMMTWAMEGIADNAPMIQASQLEAIRGAIDSAFMGAGTIFNELCGKIRG
ncbi:MAG: hypothetical protein ABII00_03105 [Elusimicrobiota bacterium]